MTHAADVRPDPVNEIVVLVRSRLGLIALDADDPAQARETLAAAAAQLGCPLFFWTRTKGLVRKNGGPAIASTQMIPRRRAKLSPRRPRSSVARSFFGRARKA